LDLKGVVLAGDDLSGVDLSGVGLEPDTNREMIDKACEKAEKLAQLLQ
jgi:hypothetical protein